MKAVFREKYGGIENLEIDERPRPKPKRDELLVEVRASSVNPADLYIAMGVPWLVRLVEGVGRPRKAVIGRDYAGVIVEVGNEITGFAVGDEIYGEATQTWAGFVCVKAKNAYRKPVSLSFDAAACAPLAGLTALQAIKKAPTVAGKRVLVVGASGGVGTFAVQLAASMGAQVVGIASTRNLEMVRGLGAAQVEDYEEPESLKSIAPCDVVIDTVCSRNFAEVLPWLAEGGVYVVVGATINMNSLLGRFAGPAGAYLKLMLAKKHGRRLAIVTAKPNDGIAEMSGLLESGQVKPVITKQFQLSDAVAALAYLKEKRPGGKISLVV
ncbi:MAG: NAD(P)-dependent alcohol dehydrogenase [Actinobacteria bacterium]|nr:NAD(P)-dependent alcohol dehydrogenase [Actinomycetota bacterium]